MNYLNDSLILVGHGSTLNAESSAPTYQHAAELRRRGVFGEVVEAFWKLEPNLVAVQRAVFGQRVFIVPLFISEGYFTETVIPREMGFAAGGTGLPAFPQHQRRQDRDFYYCGPVGTHLSMTGVLLARAASVVSQHPFPSAPKPQDCALFIAGHGTGNNENSRKAIEVQVEAIRARGLYGEVHPAFMEEEPKVADCYQVSSMKNLVMVPFFISDGLHSYEDIPMMLGEPERVVRERLKQGVPTWRNPTERRGKRVWYSRSVGNEPAMAEVVLQRVDEACGLYQETAQLEKP